MAKHLLAGVTGATTNSGTFASPGYTWGTDFGISGSTGLPMTGVRHYAAASSDRPNWLRVHDKTAGTVLAYVLTSGVVTVGWHVYALDTPVTLPAGHSYQVTGYWPTGSVMSYFAPANRGTPDAPLLFGDVFGWYTHSESALPASEANNGAVLPPLDVEFEGTSGGGAGTGGTAQTGDLAAWLSSDPTTQAHNTDGLPWLTKTVVDAIRVATDKLGHSGSGNALDWVKALWDLAGDFSDAEIGWLKGFLSKRDQLVGASGGGGSAFYGPSGTQVATGVETLLATGLTATDLGAAVALLRERLTLSPDLADGTRWTLVDTTSGEGDALVSQQADAYFLAITAYPASQPAHGVAATLWLPRWGWVCPRVHGHFAQRQFHDVTPTIITAEGHLMDGLLIHTPQGFEWTCESYVLDR